MTSPWVRAKTAAGAIVLRGAVEDAGAETVSGRVTATLAGARRVRLESVTGDVSLGGAMERDGAVTVETHSGAVEVSLPEGTAADYDVTTIAASIDNRLTAQRPMASRVRGGSELHLSTGGGGVCVTVRSFKGKVVLRAR